MTNKHGEREYLLRKGISMSPDLARNIHDEVTGVGNTSGAVR